MSIFDKLKNNASNKEALYASNGGSAQAGEGTFFVSLTGAEVGKNRDGSGSRVKLTYKVTDVIEGDAGDVGRDICEYISQKSKDDMIEKKATILLDQLLGAGIKEEKLQDEEDVTAWDGLSTMVGYLSSKYLAKPENTDKVKACIRRVKSDKLAENGKPYYNNYFNPIDSASEGKKESKTAEKSPYKSKHATEDEED